MKIRDWATPLTMGTFFLMAVTGLLMFFHFDRGLNKLAHEWLSWVMVSAAGLHAAVNFNLLKRYLANRKALGVIGLCLLALGASFASPSGGKPKSPQIAASQALLDTPIPLVAQVAVRDAGDIVAALNAAGMKARLDGTLRQAAGESHEAQLRALGIAFHQ